MSIGIYADVQIPKPITVGLRMRGVDVLTAQDDGMREAEDFEILDRATELNRILFTHDDDFLKLAAKRMAEGTRFSGVVYAHQLQAPIRPCVDDLELIATVLEVTDLANRVEFSLINK